MKINHIYNAECLDTLRTEFQDNTINLTMTSPPYADNRKATYDGVEIENYVKWFLPISKEIHRVTTEDGSFILNIKERVRQGERGTYVLELILALKKQGWLWTEEYIWHKKNCFPGKWPNRFRDAWERCLHFTKNKKFKMNQNSVMIPVGNWSEKRLANLSASALIVDKSKTGSGFGKNQSNWIGRKKVYPSNVLHLATECTNRGHSAAFPVSLPTWFIQLFTDKNDLVLDPFMGSGTTAIACKKLKRNYIGMEINKKYYQLYYG